MDVPPIKKLSENHGNSSIYDVTKCFESYFGSSPDFYVRVPGRVNLIGEHIDYCGFAVLPMAIEQDMLLAVKINSDDKINLINYESEKYEKFSTSVHNLNIDASCPKWYLYFLCGYKGVAEQYNLVQKGLDVTVKGTIPPSSGLSSSSALVCAAALATVFANRIFLTKMEMASLCAVSERFIGTQGGGMDQAIGFLAESETAKLIEFNPLKASSVSLPPDVVFVVSNSCVPMNKAATSQFNIRVAECKLAAKVLAKKNGLNWRSIEKLAELPVLLGKQLSDMKQVIEKHLSQKVYTASELCSLLEINESEFTAMLSENTRHLMKFQLSDRAMHVYEEASRVMQFKMLCDSGNKDVERFGHLMNESHRSCRDLYECSHPDLDELVETALSSGALGSRLTGAGWGGCCVSLVRKSQVSNFMELVKKNFYKKKEETCSRIDTNSSMFVTSASSGASIYLIKNTF